MWSVTDYPSSCHIWGWQQELWERRRILSLSLNSHEKNTKTWIKHRTMPTISLKWRWADQGSLSFTEKRTSSEWGRRVLGMFTLWRQLYNLLCKVATSVHVLSPPLCRKGKKEMESCPDVVFGCLHLCTGAQLHSQVQKYAHSQSEHDPAEKLVDEKQRQQLFARQSTNKLLTINFASQADLLGTTLQTGVCYCYTTNHFFLKQTTPF